MLDRALHLGLDRVNVVIAAPDWRCGAFVKVGAEPRGHPKHPKKLAHGGNVVAVEVAENNDVVCVEGNARGRVTCREPLEEAVVNRTEEKRVQDVDDDGEQHWGNWVSLSEAASVVDGRPGWPLIMTRVLRSSTPFNQ